MHREHIKYNARYCLRSLHAYSQAGSILKTNAKVLYSNSEFVHGAIMDMRHKAGMGLCKPEEHMTDIHCKSTVKYREQSKSCFSRRGKHGKPGNWVITPTPAPSKPVPGVDLPRKAEYSPCKTNYSGFLRTPGLKITSRLLDKNPQSPGPEKIPGPGKGKPPGSYIPPGSKRPPGPRETSWFKMTSGSRATSGFKMTSGPPEKLKMANLLSDEPTTNSIMPKNTSCFFGVVSSKQTSLFRWTCASYQATYRNPSFVGLVFHIKQQLKFGSIKKPSAPLVSPFNSSVLPFGEFISLKEHITYNAKVLPEELTCSLSSREHITYNARYCLRSLHAYSQAGSILNTKAKVLYSKSEFVQGAIMGMRHKAEMGLHKPKEHMVYIHCKGTVKYMEQSKSCFSRHGKQRKPGIWVIKPTPAPSKPSLGPEKISGPGKGKPLGSYITPGSKQPPVLEEPSGSQATSRSKATSGFKMTSGSRATSGFETTSESKINLWVKNDLRVPKQPSGPPGPKGLHPKTSGFEEGIHPTASGFQDESPSSLRVPGRESIQPTGSRMKVHLASRFQDESPSSLQVLPEELTCSLSSREHITYNARYCLRSLHAYSQAGSILNTKAKVLYSNSEFVQGAIMGMRHKAGMGLHKPEYAVKTT
ncbi:hypothetical protein F2Q69_00043068 [Brassica cretica]|uniref:Uncharacterized protein n=1 Tax=Brassica cretica TaxID=69181 RepID=A0A8S9NR88_BRACR|nr:hypothetical protein F2Q69_00043068 [Brassica cretica]